jgi:glutamate--cysteine ligase catalytic subunit
MEAQMTDFENASFVVFIVLLSRAIMSMNLNFYIPISKVRTARLLRSLIPDTDLPNTQVDENMRRAQQRDAVNQAKFFFRREIFTPASSRATSGATTPNDDSRPSLPRPSLPNGTRQTVPPRKATTAAVSTA